MDPVSLATGITALISGITKLSLEVAVLVGALRDAQSDMNRVKIELETLTSVLLQIQQTDNSRLPPQLVQSLPTVLNSCTDVVVEMIAILQKLSTRGGIRRKIQWVTTSKSDIGSLRANLEAHKSTLHLAIMIGSAQSDQLILGEIALLQRSLPRGGTGFALQRFLEDTATYAGSYYGGSVIDDNATVVHEFSEERIRESFEDSPPRPIQNERSRWRQESPPFDSPGIRPSKQPANPSTNQNSGASKFTRIPFTQRYPKRNQQREEVGIPTNRINPAAPASPEDTDFDSTSHNMPGSWVTHPKSWKNIQRFTNSNSRFFCSHKACSYSKDNFLGYHSKEELDDHMKLHTRGRSETTPTPVVKAVQPLPQTVPRNKPRNQPWNPIRNSSRYFCARLACSYNEKSFLGWHNEEELYSHMKSCRVA